MKTRNLIIGGLFCAAAMTLIGGTPAPEKKDAQTTNAVPFMDAAGSCFRFGDKTVQVTPSGYIRITKSDKLIATVYFFGNTPYSSYFDNVILEVKKFPHPYSKKRTGVSSFSADKAQNAFIIKGKIPYQKDGEAEILGDYTQTVSLTPENKIRVKLEFTRPESVEKGSLSMFCSVPQAKTYTNDKEPKEFGKKWVELKKKFPVIANGTDADNTFRIISIMMNQMWAVPGKQINFGSIADKRKPNIRIIEFELDLLNGEGQK